MMLNYCTAWCRTMHEDSCQFMTVHDWSLRFMAIKDSSWQFTRIHGGSWWFTRIHKDAWGLMTIHDSSWRFITAYADPWQFMTIHDDSCGFMTVHDGSWQFMMTLEGRVRLLRKVRSRVLRHLGRLIYTLTSGTDLTFPDTWLSFQIQSLTFVPMSANKNKSIQMQVKCHKRDVGNPFSQHAKDQQVPAYNCSFVSMV